MLTLILIRSVKSKAAPLYTPCEPPMNNFGSLDVDARGTAMLSTNCWDFYHCPPERRQTCSAFKQNAGRKCWLVAGTLCGGSIQSAYAMKIGGCQKCEFYMKVMKRQI